MCGRFTLRHPDRLAERFQLNLDLDQVPRFNIAPTQIVPIIVQHDDRRAVVMARWGLVPAWAKDTAIGNKLINARAETLPEKASFRAALRARRCLVPADGFYEWVAPATAKAGRARVPHFIHRRDDDLFAFAGLYEEWRGAVDQPLISFTIITTTPNEVMQPLHHRMPAILQAGHEDGWLSPGLVETGAWRALLEPYPAELLTAHPVSARVNSPHYDAPDIVEPVPA